MFGQLNKCYTLEDISAGIGVNKIFISDLGSKPKPGAVYDERWERKTPLGCLRGPLQQAFALLQRHSKSKHKSEVIEEVKRATIKLIDSTVVSLCLNLFSWAKYRTAKGGLKIHICFDDTLGLLDVINITEGKVSDIKGHPQSIFPKGTIIVEDRGYFDFSLMAARCAAENYFVTRIKDDTIYEVLCERPLPAGEDEHIILDQGIMFTKSEGSQKRDRSLRAAACGCL